MKSGATLRFMTAMAGDRLWISARPRRGSLLEGSGCATESSEAKLHGLVLDELLNVTRRSAHRLVLYAPKINWFRMAGETVADDVVAEVLSRRMR